MEREKSDIRERRAGRPGSDLHALLAQVVKQLIPEDSDMAASYLRRLLALQSTQPSLETEASRGQFLAQLDALLDRLLVEDRHIRAAALLEEFKTFEKALEADGGREGLRLRHERGSSFSNSSYSSSVSRGNSHIYRQQRERDDDRHGRDFEGAFSYGRSGDEEHYTDGEEEWEWEEEWEPEED